MRKYLATLHKKSDAHKKNFALAVSGGTTLLIFAFWMLVNFGSASPEAVQASAHEVSPFESIAASLASSWAALKDGFAELSQGFGEIDLKSGYEDLKGKTLNQYGR